MEYGCPLCGWTGDDPMKSRGVESNPVAFGGDSTGRPWMQDPGFVVMEKQHVTKAYCPECHKPLPKSQQSGLGMTPGQSEQIMSKMLLLLGIVAVVGYIALT
ncbi:MAG: hypothetical protein CMA93_02970 [Euryarchaeota archaeon]|nr:hypothetical protein [Euryarchaeota archaeon]